MKVKSLKRELNNRNIDHKIVDINGFNMRIVFKVNGIEISSMFDTKHEKLLSFCIKNQQNSKGTWIDRQFTNGATKKNLDNAIKKTEYLSNIVY